jgi:hypothetical protein
MPRRIACALAFAAAAAGLVWAGWRGTTANPAILINRVDVIAAVVLLAALPWAVRRVFGPPADSWLARIVRAGGYAIVLALVLIKANVERSEYASPAGRPGLAGVWTGEVVFLAVLAAYVAGLLAVTARRPTATPATLATGVVAGIAAGLVMYALPPVGSPLHIATAWRAGLYDAARVLALLLVLGGTIAAGMTAARRAAGRGGRLPLADAKARQGVAAGLCAGAAAALVASLLGISTIALLPQEANRLVWALENRHLPSDTVYEFEVGVSDSAAGHLAVLAFFPLLGAGLGAWGGLYGAGQPRRRPDGGGGGGGGGKPPGPVPPPPRGGRRDDDGVPAILRGYLRELPAAEELAAEGEHAAPGQRSGV